MLQTFVDVRSGQARAARRRRRGAVRHLGQIPADRPAPAAAMARPARRARSWPCRRWAPDPSARRSRHRATRRQRPGRPPGPAAGRAPPGLLLFEPALPRERSGGPNVGVRSERNGRRRRAPHRRLGAAPLPRRRLRPSADRHVAFGAMRTVPRPSRGSTIHAQSVGCVKVGAGAHGAAWCDGAAASTDPGVLDERTAATAGRPPPDAADLEVAPVIARPLCSPVRGRCASSSQTRGVAAVSRRVGRRGRVCWV